MMTTSEKGSLLGEYMRTKREVIRLSKPVEEDVSECISPPLAAGASEENHQVQRKKGKRQIELLTGERESLRRLEVQLVQEIEVAGLRKCRETLLLGIVAQDLRIAHDRSMSIATQIVNCLYNDHAHDTQNYQARLDESSDKIKQLEGVIRDLRVTCESLNTDLQSGKQELADRREDFEKGHAASITKLVNAEQHFHCELDKMKVILSEEFDENEQNQKVQTENQNKIDALKSKTEMDELRADIDLLGNEFLKSRDTIAQMQSMLDQEAEARRKLEKSKEEMQSKIDNMQKEVETSRNKLRLCEEEKRRIIHEQKQRRMMDISLVEERVKKMSVSYELKLNVAMNNYKKADNRANEAEKILLQLEQNFFKCDQPP